MKITLEKLWDEYLAEECATIETEEERKTAKCAISLHEKANALLSKEQEIAVEKYVDALSDIQSLFVKKAFFKGCEFAFSFLVGTEFFVK